MKAYMFIPAVRKSIQGSHGTVNNFTLAGEHSDPADNLSMT
jgi:hypothetical protein